MRPFPQTQPFHRVELTLTIAKQTLPRPSLISSMSRMILRIM